jgi:hypothetical protein
MAEAFLEKEREFARVVVDSQYKQIQYVRNVQARCYSLIDFLAVI